MVVSSYHYLAGPLVAAGAMVVVLLICRWVFSTGHRPPRTVADEGFGLLVPVARGTAEEVARLAVGLRAEGVRATSAAAGPESAQERVLLVFHEDAPRAEGLLRAGR